MSRFHLPVGQPLASDCRPASSWVPFLGLMRFEGFVGRQGETVRAVAHGQASGRAPALYIFAHHGHEASKTCTSRALRGWPRIGQRRAWDEGGGQGVGHRTASGSGGGRCQSGLLEPGGA